jgi:hypothetical protein
MTDSSLVAEDTNATSRRHRDAALAHTFRSGELVWLVNEQYVADGPTWRVTLVRQGPQGRWMRQRYRYDIPSQVLYFVGEQPITDAELSASRLAGRPLP